MLLSFAKISHCGFYLALPGLDIRHSLFARGGRQAGVLFHHLSSLLFVLDMVSIRVSPVGSPCTRDIASVYPVWPSIPFSGEAWLSPLGNRSYATCLWPIRQRITLLSCMANCYSNSSPLKPFSSVSIRGFQCSISSKSSINAQTFLSSYKARCSLRITSPSSPRNDYLTSSKSPVTHQSPFQLSTISGSCHS